MLTVKKAYDEGLLGKLFTIESKLHSANGLCTNGISTKNSAEA